MGIYLHHVLGHKERWGMLLARQSGVTLIELVIAIAVLGIVIAMGLPSYSNWIANSQIRTTAESLLAGLQLARNEAVRRNTSVRFSLVTNLTNTCQLSSTGTNWIVSRLDPAGKCGNGTSDIDPFIIQLKASAEGGSNATINADGTNVVFNGIGRVVTSVGQISQISIDSSSLPSAQTRDLRIVIGSAGEIRMCDPDPNVGTTDPRRC